MLDLLTDLYGKFRYLGVAEIAALLKIGRVKHINAGEVLIKTGDWDYNAYVVIKGLLRTYVETPEGEEKTVFFAGEGMNSGSSATFLYEKPSTESIMAIEKSILAVHDTREFEKLCREYPKLMWVQNEALKMNLGEAIERLSYYTTMGPEERYLHFRDKYPDLINRVPQIYLASYLGVHVTSLSRIRSRISANQN